MCVCRGCYLLFTDSASRAALPCGARPVSGVPGFRSGPPRVDGAADPGRHGLLLHQLRTRTAPSPSIPARPVPPNPSWTWTHGAPSAAPTRGSACWPTTWRRCWSGCPERRRCRSAKLSGSDRRLLRVRRTLAHAVARFRRRPAGHGQFIDDFFARIAARARETTAAMTDRPMDVTFAVLDVAPEPYAVTPVLTAPRRRRRQR